MEPQTNQQESKQDKFELNKLIPNIPFSVYAKSDGMNSSGIKDILRSPAHFYQRKFEHVQTKETEALQFGKLLHYAVLEPELFKKHYIVQPKMDKRTAAGKSEYELFKAKLLPDAIVVPEEMVHGIKTMTDKILNHKIASKLMERGVRETTLFWEDRETKELCKMRPDFISAKGYIVDLKTSKDARLESFQRDIMKYLYHIQAAHYCEGARVAGVCRPDAFIFLVIEKDPPYEIAIYPAGASVLGVGDQWRSKAMGIYSRCKKRNVWPGYNHEARTIELPRWAEAVDPDDEE